MNDVATTDIDAIPAAVAPTTVAVAIACCNQGLFLPDAIDSILAQTRPADEIIVVDDGSCDNTSQVARRYPQVRYHFQTNAGLSAARNTGLRLATTQRILFLDSDDMLLPNALADGMAAFDANPGVAFVYGGYREVTEYRELMFERHAETHADGFAGLLRGNHVSMHGTVIYDAALLAASGGFDTALKSCEDYDVFLRLAREHPIAAYASIGAEYRRHGNNMTGNHIRMMRMSRLVVKRHMENGPLTPGQRAAGTFGIDFMTGYYAHCALADVGMSARRIRSLLWGGFTTDPKFAWRIVTHTAVSIGRKVKRLFVPPPKEPVDAPPVEAEPAAAPQTGRAMSPEPARVIRLGAPEP